MQVHRLTVVEGIGLDIEEFISDEGLGFYEFGVEKLIEYFAVTYDVRVLHFGFK